MEKTLTKKNFPQWLKKLAAHTLYAPQRDGNRWNIRGLKKLEDIDLDFPNTVLTSKGVIYPQREVFLEFSTNDGDVLQVKEVLPEDQPAVIIGLRPCDGRASAMMDKVFGGAIEDPYYWKRRNQTTLIGLACLTPPSPNCFCLSVGGSPHATEGLDILLTDFGDRYHVESLTKKGDRLINESKALFQEKKPGDAKILQKIHTESEKSLPRELKKAKDLPAKLKPLFDSPFWDEESMSCIRCGICTYLCPTCHCFDINDEVESSNPLRGNRVRTWDNCQFPDFTMHSSGHNPRPDKASRLRQRLFHKFQYFFEIHKNFQCIGCGRCISYCPVGIDIIKVLEKVNDHE